MRDQTHDGATTRWLNPQRIRRQALLLATALWLGYAVTIATPGMRDRFGHLKGADFLHAYILGTVALEHRGDALYDARVQREIGEQRVPESAGDYFLPVYGPQYSLIWAPLALLPYAWAAAIWMLLSAAIYAACCYAAWRTCPNLGAYGSTVALVAAAFPGFFGLITFGQNSAFALACFTGAYFALRARREVLAGLCLGLLAYKPQLAMVAACVFVAAWVWPRKPNPERLENDSDGPPHDCVESTALDGHDFAWCGKNKKSSRDRRRAALQGRVSRVESAWALALVVVLSPFRVLSSRLSSRAVKNAGEAPLGAERDQSDKNVESRPAGTTNLGACNIVIGAVISVVVQLLAAGAWYGTGPLRTYAHVLARLGSTGNRSMAQILEPKPYLMHSLRAFWNLLLPWPSAAFALYFLTALAAIALAIWSWRRPEPIEHRFAVMLSATVLVAPHLTVYDLVILAPAFLWIGDWLRAHASPRIAWLLYLAYILPFAGPLARWTHLQLSVICFAALTVSFCWAQPAENPQPSHDRGRAAL